MKAPSLLVPYTFPMGQAKTGKSKMMVTIRDFSALLSTQTLGKALNTLGKDFAECSTRHTAHDDCLLGKDMFAEYFSSGTRQTLCRVSRRPSAKKKSRWHRRITVTVTLPSVVTTRHSAKTACLPSAEAQVLSKASLFAECRVLDTRQTLRPGA